MESESENKAQCEILAEKARNAHALALRLNADLREKLADVIMYLGYHADGHSFYQVARAVFAYGVDALSRLRPEAKVTEILKQLKACALEVGRPCALRNAEKRKRI